MTDQIRSKELKKADEVSALADNYFAPVQRAVKRELTDFLSSVKKDSNNLESYIPPASNTISRAAYKLFVFSFLLGMDHAQDNLTLADIEEIFPDETVEFEEAVKFAKSRLPLTKEEFADISAKLKFRAFAVSRLTQLDAVEKVKQHIIKSTKTGSIADFISDLSEDDIVQRAGFSSSSPWYWETVYRTNVQTNYNAGRAFQFKKNPPEFLEFIGINDSRQSDICDARNRIILPYNDSWWIQNWPPLHFNCRSTVRAIYKEEAEARGLKSTKLPTNIEAAQGGFGSNPLDSGTFWKLTRKMAERISKYTLSEEVFQVEQVIIHGKEKVPDFKTSKQAEKWAREHDLADTVSYKGLSPDIATEMTRAVYDARFDFPELRGRLKFIGSAQEQNRIMREHYEEIFFEKYKKRGFSNEAARKYAKSSARKIVGNISRRTYAVSRPLGPAQGIGFNSAWSDIDELKEGLAIDVRHKFHPVGCDSIRSVADHEIGHQLDELLSLSKKEDILKIWKRYSNEEMTDELSRYAWLNDNQVPLREMIAEAWAELRNNPNPRALSREVGEIIMEAYRKWKN